MWTAQIFTLYPDLFPGPLNHGIYGRALKKKIWKLKIIDIRKYAFDKYKEIIKDNNIVFLVGHTSTQNDFADLKLIVDEVVPINHAKKVLKLNEVNIRLPKNSSKDLMNDIVELANQNKGDHSFVVHIPGENGQERKIISKKIKVSNNSQFLILLRDLLGESNVWID